MELNGGQLLLQYDTQNNVIEKNILTAGSSRIFIANYFTSNKKTDWRGMCFIKKKGRMVFGYGRIRSMTRLKSLQMLPIVM